MLRRDCRAPPLRSTAENTAIAPARLSAGRPGSSPARGPRGDGAGMGPLNTTLGIKKTKRHCIFQFAISLTFRSTTAKFN